MFNQEQKNKFEHLAGLTNGMIELLKYTIKSKNLSTDELDIVKCNLVIMNEIHKTIFELCTCEEMYRTD